jgi:hypothetical protein
VSVFARPVLAVVFGAFIICAETCLHFESLAGAVWLDMPWHDWFAGGWLVVAGWRSQTPSPSLTAAWAFMLSLLVAAFFGQMAEWWMPSSGPSNGWLSEGTLLAALSGLTATAACAVIVTLRHGDPSRDSK